MKIEPILPDVLEPNLRAVFCGTAASHESRRQGAYYAHPGNRFWRTLHEGGLTPRQLSPHDFANLPQYGLGLTDLAKHHSGQDADLPGDAFDVAGLINRIEQSAPDLLAFTSKTAASAVLGSGLDYGEQSQMIGGTRLWVLPSTSGLAARYFDMRPWLELANEAREASSK